jgi:hypothetical protein
MSEEGPFLIRGADLIDGTGAPARPATVILDRGRIRAIDGDAPAEATVLDLPGHTVLPGRSTRTHISGCSTSRLNTTAGHRPR